MGAVLNLAKKAKENPEQAHILIIDEMNRGNLQKYLVN